MTEADSRTSQPNAAAGAGDDSRLLIFLHIPKTAGTTFGRVIRRQYPEGSVVGNDRGLAHVDLEALKALPDERKRTLRVVQGHMPFGVHELFPQPASYVTILRDPVARMISHYKHVLRVKHHYLHDEVVSRGMSLLDYASSGMSPELENGQTKLIAGLAEDVLEATPEDLEAAKRNLREHFILAGLSERFDESLLVLRPALGWKNVTYDRANVAPRSTAPPVEPAAIAAVRERNLLDVELYGLCKALLEERIAALGPAFERELKVFRARNAMRAVVNVPARRVRRRLRTLVRRP
jgi:hypothetical protein